MTMSSTQTHSTACSWHPIQAHPSTSQNFPEDQGHRSIMAAPAPVGVGLQAQHSPTLQAYYLVETPLYTAHRPCLFFEHRQGGPLAPSMFNPRAPMTTKETRFAISRTDGSKIQNNVLNKNIRLLRSGSKIDGPILVQECLSILRPWETLEEPWVARLWQMQLKPGRPLPERSGPAAAPCARSRRGML